ncbi:MAG: VWA domain-containing protein [Polyangiaceae bacterium]|nr:VWA domain-containing protein [Polyangiaceae bacterium]
MKWMAFIATLLLLAAPAFARPTVNTTWRYERGSDGQVIDGRRSVPLPIVVGNERFSTDPGIDKTILLAQMANGVRDRLAQYEAACPWPIRENRTTTCSSTTRRRIALALRQDINRWNQRALANAWIRSDTKVLDTLDLLRTLAANIEATPRLEPAPRLRAFAAAPGLGAFHAGGSLGVTGGGAQDFGFFRKLVLDGRVPDKDVLTVEGFLREFQLPLHLAPACARLVCVHPAAAFDPQQNRLYVQIGMNSAVTEATFTRKPLNLSIVLDVSGSMSATDETEKARLEWAKDALEQTVRQLDARDILSIVIFDTNSEILRRPARVNDPERIIAKVRRLSTRNTTNLEAGLRDGYMLASENVDRLSGYEHRVLLITDAGLNTGVVDESDILRLVTDNASRGIGLTALGLGENFKQEFIHGITNSRGGNYVFVHSGKDMLRYFDAFKYLVTPIAYNFRVRLGLSDIQAKLVAVNGVPTESGTQPVRPVIDLPTLFFSETGGAMLLEYELPRGE